MSYVSPVPEHRCLQVLLSTGERVKLPILVPLKILKADKLVSIPVLYRIQKTQGSSLALIWTSMGLAPSGISGEGESGWLIFFILWVCKPLQILQSFSNFFIGDPVLSPWGRL